MLVAGMAPNSIVQFKQLLKFGMILESAQQTAPFGKGPAEVVRID